MHFGAAQKGESVMKAKSIQFAVWVAAGVLLAAAPGFADSQNQQGQGQAVITVLPAKNAPAAEVSQQNLAVKVNGKDSSITNWRQYGPDSPVEMVVLIDGSARSSLGTQMSEISHFIDSLPANVRVTAAYMENGRAVLTGPLSTNRAQVAQSLHITGALPGISASPYFCLSDLAQHWPSSNSAARREVVMLTDGVDYYDSVRRYNPEDPYVQAAITDAVRAKIMVYTIYWRNVGFIDRSPMAEDTGQNLLLQVSAATGGNSYWMGYGDPVSLQPYLDDITRRLDDQYEVSFMTPSNGKQQVASFRMKLNAPGTKIDAPDQVLVMASETAGGEQ
jgi:hypothetical protein